MSVSEVLAMATFQRTATEVLDELPAPVVFYDVTWNDYEAMLRIVGERPIRVTYNQGTTELFKLSFGHENDAYLLGRMVDTLTEELEIPVVGGGATTHKREHLDKGAEPDQCYWLRDRAERMLGKRELDLNVDPYPDLIIEVEVTHHLLDRIPIFAALGVPEVWRCKGRTVEFLHRQKTGTYRARANSRNFPSLTAAVAASFLEQGRIKDTTAWIRSFRKYVREHLLPQA
jgi:Uma2 family endonuclease